jgi:hypothetical protein
MDGVCSTHAIGKKPTTGYWNIDSYDDAMNLVTYRTIVIKTLTTFISQRA